MLEIKNLSKSFLKTKALNEVNLSLAQGEIVGLFGENGAGKTTLLKCILGYLRYQGAVTLDAEPICTKNIARLSFATCEHSFFPNLTATGHKEFYELHFPTFRNKRFHGLMEFFELPTHKAIRQLSTGQKNQFEVILALSQGADYILMDEPFAGNDIFNRADFYKLLLGVLEPTETLVLSTHLLEEVDQFIGRAVLLHKGEIVGDTSMQVLEECGQTLLGYVQETYQYKANRVSKALDDLTGEV
ncbi:MAG: ABC transporter ATP-binding protein [Evtepia sp.]